MVMPAKAYALQSIISTLNQLLSAHLWYLELQPLKTKRQQPAAAIGLLLPLDLLSQ